MTSLNVLGVTCADSAKWLVERYGKELTITFDHRPRSFQFTQLYICNEIMTSEAACRYGFYFSQEKDFMVKNVVLEANNHGKIKCYFPDGIVSENEEQFFSELNSENFYSLEVAYKKNLSISAMDFIVDADDVVRDILSNRISDLIKMQTHYLGRKFSLKVKTQHIGFLAQIQQYIHFEEIIFEIDQEVMLGYRQLDYQKLEHHLLRISQGIK